MIFNGVEEAGLGYDSFSNAFRVNVLKTTTEKYYEYFIKRDIKIDMLWIDADHTLRCKKDFDLYSQHE